MGNRDNNIRRALADIERIEGVSVRKTSTFIETDPVGGLTEQGKFLNGVIQISTKLSPYELLRHLQAIEQALGRPPAGERTTWGPRPIDLDILLYGEDVCNTPELVIPHPRMQERGFVMIPLREIAPELKIPSVNPR